MDPDIDHDYSSLIDVLAASYCQAKTKQEEVPSATPGVQQQHLYCSSPDARFKQGSAHPDSLLGMTSALFASSQIMNPSHSVVQVHHNSNTFNDLKSSNSGTSSAIASEVLAELSEDLFQDPHSSGGMDMLDLEPTPLRPSPQEVHRFNFLKNTLNKVLQDEDLFNCMLGEKSSTPTTSSLLPPPEQGAWCSTNSFNPSHHSSTNQTFCTPGGEGGDLDYLFPPPCKKQRTVLEEHHMPHGDQEDDEDDEKSRRFRPYQSEQWSEKFQELLDFEARHGHCLVPHSYEENPSLARWVKRQRYQYKLKNEGKTSTMTDERVVSLEKVGFVWDSHAAAWEERRMELADFRLEHGHCNVPSNYRPNSQLATWIKCQRRQYKLFRKSPQKSNMTVERVQKLEHLGFEWELRGPRCQQRPPATVTTFTSVAWK